MSIFYLTVKEFADNYIPSIVRVRVVKDFEKLFEGTLEELYNSGTEILNSVVIMVGADNGIVCLSCRD
jgi:hypothetical protein